MINLLAQPTIQKLLHDPAITPMLAERRAVAIAVMQAALDAVDPAEAVRRAVHCVGDVLTVGGRDYSLRDFERIVFVGAGKAGAPMATSLWDILAASDARAKLVGGTIIVKEAHLPDRPCDPRLRFVEGGHPIPNAAGFAATDDIIEIVRDAGEHDLVFALISGGGSALLEAPVAGVSLDVMAALTEAMLRSGATITQLNTVRKHLSRVKGGRLVQHAHPATVVGLVLSDVVGSPLEVIASGPTSPDPTTFDETWATLRELGLVEGVPHFADADRLLAQAAPALDYIAAHRHDPQAETPQPGDPIFAGVQNLIIADNRIAARAGAARAHELGLTAAVLSTHIEGEAREVARVLAGIARSLREEDEPYLARPACLIFGGETTVTIRGGGRGGRNQEMALAAAIALDGLPDVVIAPLATDGGDGPTDAAGALADGDSLRRARGHGLDAGDYLRRNDAYNFFAAEGGLLITGPTHTNVNDITFVFVF